jgi:hypothetical protein
MNHALTSSAGVMPPGTRWPWAVGQPWSIDSIAAIYAGFEITVETRVRGFIQ